MKGSPLAHWKVPSSEHYILKPSVVIVVGDCCDNYGDGEDNGDGGDSNDDYDYGDDGDSDADCDDIED